MERVKGFTLIELMVTIAVLAIAISIAVPSFSNLITSNRAESQHTALISALSLARSEAIKRGADVSVVPLTASNWSAGWQVKLSNEVLRDFPALSDATLSGPNASVTFNMRGQLTGAGVTMATVQSFAYRVQSTGFCKLERNVTVNAMGRVAIEPRACS